MIIKNINIRGVEYQIASNLMGEGAPTTATIGDVGMLYLDTETEFLYKCTSAENNEYLWKPISEGYKNMSEMNNDAAYVTGSATQTLSDEEQKMARENINALGKGEITQTSGDSENMIMSQKAVTDAITAQKNAISELSSCVNESQAFALREIQDHADRIAINEKLISNLIDGLQEELFMEDSSVSYQKNVPARALSYAQIHKIGGATRACENLIPFPYEIGGAGKVMTINGVTYTINVDGSITANGTATSDSFCIISHIHAEQGVYTLTGCPEGGNNLKYRLYIGDIVDFGEGGSGTLTKEAALIIYVKPNVTCDHLVFYPMLNKGEKALPYELYFEGLRNAKVTEIESIGKNLIAFPYTANGTEAYGGKMTIKEDGGIEGSGIPTGATIFYLQKNITLPVGIYTISCQGVFENMCIQLGKENAALGTSTMVNVSDSYTFEMQYGETISILCKRSQNNVEMSGILYPMLNQGEESFSYVPYTRNVFSIPAEVQSLDGYGRGVNAEYHNKIVWNPAEGVKKFVKMTERLVFNGTESWNWTYYPIVTTPLDKNTVYGSKTIASHGMCSSPANVSGTYIGFSKLDITNPDIASATELNAYLAEQYNNGTPVEVEYVLAEPVETDISDYLGDDNFIGVEDDGTLTAVNEYGCDVPYTVKYMLKEETT